MRVVSGKMSALLFALGLTLIAATGGVHPVSAQRLPALYVAPEETFLPMGMVFEITLDVAGGEAINAYDLTLTYDPGIITLEKWEHGAYLSNLAVVYHKADPGVFRLAATQLATAPVSGEGTLLVLTFRATGVGITALELAEVVFVAQGGEEVEPALEDGVVTVNTEPTYTPTATATRTPTPTVTPPHTATLTPLPTFTPAPLTATAYPTEATLPEVSETAPPVFPTMDGGQPPPGGATQVDPAVAFPLSEGTDPAPPGGEPDGESGLGSEESSPPDERAESRREAAVNSLLTGILIVSLLGILVMLYILLKKRSNQKEDLLL